MRRRFRGGRMFYLITILSVMAVSLISSICVSLTAGTITLSYAVIAPLFVLLFVFVLLGILDLILRFCFPKSCWNYEKSYFSVSKKEIRFYEKLKIRKWKDRVPEWGKSAGFSKSNLQSLEVDYLEKFIFETCIGEILHLSAALLGFTCLFIFPVKHYYFVLPILITNFVLNLMPCLIQRYNRARLLVVYKFKARHNDKEIEQSEKTEQAV